MRLACLWVDGAACTYSSVTELLVKLQKGWDVYLQIDNSVDLKGESNGKTL
jgi:hypothetical protein